MQIHSIQQMAPHNHNDVTPSREVPEQPYQNISTDIRFLDENGSEMESQSNKVDDNQSHQMHYSEPRLADHQAPQQPVLQVFENPTYKSSANHKRQQGKSGSQPSIQVPDQNLMVVCYIKEPPSQSAKPRAGGQAQTQSKSIPRQNRFKERLFSRPGRTGYSQALASDRSRSMQSARSTKQGRNASCRNSVTNSTILSMSDQDFGSIGLDNQADEAPNGKKQKLMAKMKGPIFFTTQRETSQLVFQQLQNLSASYKPQEKHALSQDLIRTTLRYSKDCQSFLAGAYRSGHLDTFED